MPTACLLTDKLYNSYRPETFEWCLLLPPSTPTRLQSSAVINPTAAYLNGILEPSFQLSGCLSLLLGLLTLSQISRTQKTSKARPMFSLSDVYPSLLCFSPITPVPSHRSLWLPTVKSHAYQPFAPVHHFDASVRTCQVVTFNTSATSSARRTSSASVALRFAIAPPGPAGLSLNPQSPTRHP